jgi:sulfatase maturation enzyme AslB (radical SAM superfamily)
MVATILPTCQMLLLGKPPAGASDVSGILDVMAAWTGAGERGAVAAGVPVAAPRRRSARHDVAETHAPGCAAPSIQLRFTPVGLVFPCCRTLQPFGHVNVDRLRDIWDGVRRREMVGRLATGDYSMGCQPCEAEIALEGWEASYAAIHDEWADDPERREDGGIWPTRFDFNLSNSCNLQCVQCDGDSSSSIRIHREHRAPLPKVYGDQFFEDLSEFLPHLQTATFAGGEPFLGDENYRVWDLISELAPDLPCTVITNATQWTPRIAALLDRIAFSFIVSLDGITRETYESIRVGADFDVVMGNIARFRQYTRERGTSMSINHCLMPTNHHEFADLLLWAENQGLPVDVSVVRWPAHAAIGELPLEEIRRIHATLVSRQDEVLPQLSLNRQTWLTEVGRIGSWAEDSEGAHGSRSTRMVLWFKCVGEGPTDTSEAREELARFAEDGVVHEAVVGLDDQVVRCSPDLLDDPSQIVGQGFHMLAKVLSQRFGTMQFYEVISTGDDRMDVRAMWGTTESRIIGVPLRGSDGRASEASMLFGFRSESAD